VSALCRVERLLGFGSESRLQDHEGQLEATLPAHNVHLAPPGRYKTRIPGSNLAMISMNAARSKQRSKACIATLLPSLDRAVYPACRLRQETSTEIPLILPPWRSNLGGSQGTDFGDKVVRNAGRDPIFQPKTWVRLALLPPPNLAERSQVMHGSRGPFRPIRYRYLPETRHEATFHGPCSERGPAL